MTQQIFNTEGDYEPVPAAEPTGDYAKLKAAYDELLVQVAELLEKNKKLRFRLQTIRGITTDDDNE